MPAKTVGIKIKSSDFQVITRAHTIKTPISSATDLYSEVYHLFSNNVPSSTIRLIGVRVSSLCDLRETVTLDRFVSSHPKCPNCSESLQNLDNQQINSHLYQCLSRSLFEEQQPKRAKTQSSTFELSSNLTNFSFLVADIRNHKRLRTLYKLQPHI